MNVLDLFSGARRLKQMPRTAGYHTVTVCESTRANSFSTQLPAPSLRARECVRKKRESLANVCWNEKLADAVVSPLSAARSPRAGYRTD